MPAGILTVIFRFFRTDPAPLQVLQGVWMSLPVPPHLGQLVVVAKENAPPPRWMRMVPEP